MKIVIRQEDPTDCQKVFELIERAFANQKYSENDEQYLVERLRKINAFIPELSLVAEYKGETVGHILLTKVTIISNSSEFYSLILAPVSVLPDFQKKGIGSKLIKSAHRRAKELGYKSVVLIGHENYYPKFGYELTSKFGIKLPFEAPEKNCMVVELIKDGLKNVRGEVKFPKEFY